PVAPVEVWSSHKIPVFATGPAQSLHNRRHRRYFDRKLRRCCVIIGAAGRLSLAEGQMLIGVPREIKNNEFRVGMVPSSVAELVQRGHEVVVETGAGAGIGFADDDYAAAGATIAATAPEVFAAADMVVKVKEPLAQERALLRPG